MAWLKWLEVCWHFKLNNRYTWCVVSCYVTELTKAEDCQDCVLSARDEERRGWAAESSVEASRYYGQDLVVSFTQSQSGAAEEDISPTKTWARNIDIIGPELERLSFVLQSFFFFTVTANPVCYYNITAFSNQQHLTQLIFRFLSRRATILTTILTLKVQTNKCFLAELNILQSYRRYNYVARDLTATNYGN